MKDSYVRTKPIKPSGENTRVNPRGSWIRQWFLRYDSKSTSKEEKKEITLHQNSKLLSFQGWHQESEDNL